MKKEFKKPSQVNPWSEVTQLGILIMNLILVTTWYDKIFPWKIPWINLYLFFLIVMAFGYYSSKLIKRMRIKPTFQRWFYIIIVIILIPLTLKIFAYQGQVITFWNLYFDPILKLFSNTMVAFEFLHILFILGLIVLSTWLANIMIDTSQVIRTMQIGFILFLFYGAFYMWQEPSPNILPFSIFLFVSLFTLAISRLDAVGHSKGGQIPKSNRKWLILIILIVSILLLIVVGAGSLLGIKLSNIITIVFFLIVATIIFLAILISSPIILIFNWLIGLITNTLSNAPPEPFESAQILENPLTKAILDEVNDLETLINAPGIAQIIVNIGLFILLIILILTFLKKKKWIPQMSNIEELSSTISPGKLSFKVIQLDWIKQLENYSLRKSLSLYQIRRIYNQFLITCQKNLEFSRNDAETPIEFYERLAKKFPTLKQDVLQITNTYNLIRYGMHSETNLELDLVKTSWRNITKEISHLTKK